MRCPLATAMIVGALLAIPTTVPTGVQKGATPAVPNAGAEHDAAAYPSYQRFLLLESTSETSANISFGDVDGDGKLDVVLAKGRHWPLVDRVLLGDGHGGIWTSYNLGKASDRSYSGRIADMDGDGSLDVVISNDAPDPKLVYLNDGKGHFRVGSTYGRSKWETRNASVTDVNGDGLPDIIVANRSNKPANYVCLNRGRGRFDTDCIPFARYPATTITPADINRDGLIDLVVPHRDGGQSYVYLVGRGGSLSDSSRVPFGPRDATIRMAEVADFNADGFLDVAAIDERTGVSLYFGQRDGNFSSSTAVGDRSVIPYAVAVGDLNHDGKVDIVVGHVEAPSTTYFNDGSGRHFSPVIVGDSKGTVYGFAIGDLDHDGFLDIGVGAVRSAECRLLWRAHEAENPLTTTDPS